MRWTIVMCGALLSAPVWPQTPGQVLYEQRCASCHALGDSEGPGAGPDLKNVFGRRAGSLPNFPYSPGMRALNKRWTRQLLDAYLAAPRREVPGTTMLMAVPEAQERAAIIDYLQHLRSPGKR